MFLLHSSDFIGKASLPIWISPLLFFCLFVKTNTIQAQCNVLFDVSITKTNEQCPGSSDGSITISPTADSLEFSLDNIIYQLDYSFYNLAVGSYTLYARKVTDSMCLDSLGFSISTDVDNKPPNIDCIDVTVSLDSTGSLIVPIDNLIASLFDNCSDSVNISLNHQDFSFDCGDAGKNRQISITAADEENNQVTCSSTISIAPQAACTPSITVESPCSCKNNATTLQNGQFIDTIVITSLSNEIWTITEVTGLFDTASAAPPAAPIPISVGTILHADNNQTFRFSLIALHIDSVGYHVKFENGRGDSLVVSSLCAYPTPSFSLPQDTFCLGSAPLTFTGNPGDTNPNLEFFLLDGQLATTLNPSTLSTGSHTVSYTVDGGIASTTDAADAGCVYTVQESFQFAQTPAQMVCNSLVQISLPETCAANIHPDNILEGYYFCYDDYVVELYDSSVFIGNLVNSSHVGRTLDVVVTHVPSNNSCTGSQIFVEDKLPPEIICADITVSAAVLDLSPAYLSSSYGITAALPQVSDNCGTYDVDYFDNLLFDNPCDTPYNRITERVWTVEDGYGNSTQCTQLIKSSFVAQIDVRFPQDTVLNCRNFDTSYVNTGVPTVLFDGKHEMPIFPQTGFTTFFVGYTDEILPICDGTWKVLRTWSVTDWCKPIQINVNPMKHIQVIKVEDANKPRFNCPVDLTISTGFDTCNLNYDFPDVFVTDFCSRVTYAKARYYLPDSSLHEIIGTLGTPGSNAGPRDTLAIFGLSDPLPIGTTNVTYSALDDCGNQGFCTYNVTVVDAVPPIALCDPFSKVSLGLNGKAAVAAHILDDGSYDNCSSVHFKARRLDANSCQGNVLFDDKTEFCCVDVTDTLTVIFRVYDVPVVAGPVDANYQKSHSNDCQATIIVEDNLQPTCVAPPDVTADCLAFDATLWSYGNAVGTDNCNLIISDSADYTNFDSLCHIGEIIRIFTVSDTGGTFNTCTQRILVTGNQEFFVQFPDDVVLTGCGPNSTFPEPVFFKEDCELLGTGFTDDTLSVVQDACFQINRKWRITNWCSYDTTDACVDVPNPNPNSQLTAAANLPGPLVSKYCDQSDPLAATVTAVYPGTPPFEYCTIYDSAASC